MTKAIKLAVAAQKKAYAPYSKFKVGCAIVTEDGSLVPGCNVENAVYQGICAERVALTSAVAAGHKKFKEIYISTDAKIPTPPCGYCRQFLAEFFEPSAKIHLIQRGKVKKTFTLEDLLPYSFVAKNLVLE